MRSQRRSDRGRLCIFVRSFVRSFWLGGSAPQTPGEPWGSKGPIPRASRALRANRGVWGAEPLSFRVGLGGQSPPGTFPIILPVV